MEPTPKRRPRNSCKISSSSPKLMKKIFKKCSVCTKRVAKTKYLAHVMNCTGSPKVKVTPSKVRYGSPGSSSSKSMGIHSRMKLTPNKWIKGAKCYIKRTKRQQK